MTNSEERMRRALAGIRDRAMEHFTFNKEAFDARDIDALVKAGGDTCDWTMTAIEADDALKNNQ